MARINAISVWYKAPVLSLVGFSLLSQASATTSKVSVSMTTVMSMCKGLHAKITQDEFKPDLLVALARGGLIPLGFLAGESNFNNRNVRTINLQSYDDCDKKMEPRLTLPIHAEDFQGFKSILVIDDLVDSGDSLAFLLPLLQDACKEATIKTAVLFYKKRSKVVPDYYMKRTSNWIVFPWTKGCD